MNYRDVAAVNGGLDALGESLLRSKMLQEQSREREAQTGLAAQRLATDQAFRQAQQEHYNTMETNQANANNLQLERLNAQQDADMLRTVIQANPTFDEKTRGDVNDWLAEHPRFGATGIQLAKPTAEPPPNVGQNAAAQLATQIQYWSNQMDNAASDQQRAVASDNYDFLTKVRDGMTAPKPAPAAKPTIKVKTGGGPGATGPEVTQEFTPEQYQAYQAQQIPVAPPDPRQRKPGQSYKLPNGAVGTWQGNGWQVAAPAAPAAGPAQ